MLPNKKRDACRYDPAGAPNDSWRDMKSEIEDITTDARSANREIARTVLEQLGGRRFVAMTGARNILAGNRSLSFRLPAKGGWAKRGINIVTVTLSGLDLYDVEFKRLYRLEVKTVAEESGVYAEDLQKVFTEHTGLRCRI